MDLQITQGMRDGIFQCGYLHLRKVLAEEDVAKARAIIDALFMRMNANDGRSPINGILNGQVANKELDGGIYEINHVSRLDRELQSGAVLNGCREIASQLLKRNLKRSFDHAIYKSPGSGSVDWHQDQAYKRTVKKMGGVILWVPLHDVTVEHGCMQYIDRRSIGELVAHKSIDKRNVLSAELPEDAVKHVCETEVGDVIAHLPLTMHGSLPNQADTTRKAWIIHFSPWGRFELFQPSNLPHLAGHTIERLANRFG